MLHLEGGLHACAFCLGGYTHDAGTFDICVGCYAACHLHQIGQPHVAVGHGIGSRKHHLAVDSDILLYAVGRATAYIDFVEGLEHKALLPVDDEAVFQCKTVDAGDDAVCGQCLGIRDTPGNVHLYCGGCLLESSGLKHKVLECLVVGIFIDSGIVHLAVDGDGTLGHGFFLGGDEEHVVFFQRDVGHASIHDAVHIYGDDTQRAVGIHAVHDGTGGESLLG